MPNRIIKESICTSDTINELNAFEETTLYRIWVNADDYGRLDARPDILKARLYPLKKGVTAGQISAAIRRLTDVGTLIVYEVDGRPYIQVVNWDKHQRIRHSVAKCPSPQDAASRGESPQVAAKCRLTRAGAESESESESESIREVKENKHKYGEYKNVLLTDEEYRKLQAEFSDLDSRIEKLSEGIASKGYRYKSHYAAIRSWARRDKEKEAPKGETSFEIDEFADAAIDNAKKLAADLRRRYG